MATPATSFFPFTACTFINPPCTGRTSLTYAPPAPTHQLGESITVTTSERLGGMALLMLAGAFFYRVWGMGDATAGAPALSLAFQLDAPAPWVCDFRIGSTFLLGALLWLFLHV